MMGFQKTINGDMAWGIAGEIGLADLGGVRAEPFQLATVFNGGTDVKTPYGRAVTRADNPADGSPSAVGHWQTGNIGGTGTYIGLLHAPKSDVAFAYIGSDFPGLEAGTMLEAISQTAGIWVELKTAGNVGDAVAYDADGILSAAPKEVAPASTTLIPGSRIVRFDVNAGLALVALQQLPTPAVAP